MSVHVIYYQQGHKMMKAVETEEAYRRYRDSQTQVRNLTLIRHPQEDTDVAAAKRKLVQFNYSCLPTEDGCLKGATRLSKSVGMDIDHLSADEVNAMAALNEMADRKADLKILTLHWGNEYIHRPSMMQRNMAYRLIDAGADIIVGHHSHVIQPYEKYKAGHIFYSLGNFCFDKPFQSRQFSKGMGVDLYFDTDSKEIEKIEFFGIKLSFRHLMHRMPADSFKPYFAGIQNKYERLKCDTTYDTGYSEELSKRRMIERILMKLSLIQTFFFVSFKEKRMLINNLINYYFKI